MQTLREKLNQQKLWSVFCSIEMSVTPLLARMEMSSLQIDLDVLFKYSDILKVIFGVIFHFKLEFVYIDCNYK